MLEIARNLEQIAARFNAIVLVGTGLAAVLAGLFVWLGGLGFRKVLAAIVGAVSGGICGFFIIGRNIIPVMALASLAAVIAVIFERIFITILTAAIAAVFCFAVLVYPYIENTPDFNTQIKRASLQMPTYNWAIIAVLAAIFIAGGFFLWRLTSALCCAALGTLLIFTGMILLLLYKGAAPVSGIYGRSSLYAAVFITMTAFGTIEQLLLCQRPHKQPIRKKEPNKSKEEQEQANWRTT